jgi:starch phosphorylase
MEARHLALQVQRLKDLWKDIQIGLPFQASKGPFRVGESFEVQVEVMLGQLKPEELDVELYSGYMRAVDALEGSTIQQMRVLKELGNGRYLYGCEMDCLSSGRFGLTVRVRPRGDDFLKHTPRFISWC